MRRFFIRIAAGILSTVAAAMLLSSCRLAYIDLDEHDETEAQTLLQSETVPEYDKTSEKNSAYGSVTSEDRNDGKTVICLDAGHGFGDVGCQSPYGFDEKDITLAITEKVKAELEERGAAVAMTHNGKSFPSPDEIISAARALGIDCQTEKIRDNGIFDAYERSVWLNVLDAEEYFDLFVSLHVNSISDHPEISGFSVDYYENNPSVGFLRKLSAGLRDMLTEEFSAEVRLFEDNYEEAYVVNKYTNVPSVLIECGYAGNKSDASDLQNRAWQNKFAEKLADILTQYLK